MEDGSAGGASNAKVWIYHEVIFFRQRKYEALNQFHRELARMNGLLSVVVFDVRNYPYVAGVLAQGITGILTDFCTFIILLARILLGDPDSVEIKNIIVCLRKPQDGFISPGESALAMQAVFECPNDAVSKFQAETLADSVNINVEREDFAVVTHVIANLPAQTPVVRQYSAGLTERFPLFPQVVNEADALLISLADVVWRRGHNESRGPIAANNPHRQKPFRHSPWSAGRRYDCGSR
jgi:hypothetical protein